jgi:GH18 family chitinase
MIDNDLEGLDFDWEYPTGCFPEEGGDVKCGLAGNTWDLGDWADYITFMKEIRAEMKAKGLTHLALTTQPTTNVNTLPLLLACHRRSTTIMRL